MLSLIGNLDLVEILVIAAGAVLVFGRRLPEVAMRGAAQVMRLRKMVSQTWREAGLEDELRRVRWDMEREARAVKHAAELREMPPSLPMPPAPEASLHVHEPLERESLEAEPQAGDHELSEADAAEEGWSEEVPTQGPSEEELRAEWGKDDAGHPSPEDPDETEKGAR